MISVPNKVTDFYLNFIQVDLGWAGLGGTEKFDLNVHDEKLSKLFSFDV